MALVLNDRVKETSTTAGTGTLDLDGAVTGFETFVAGIATTNTTYYCIDHQGSYDEWEVGLGTLNGDSSTLTRTTVLESSNSDSAVDFSAGSKEVFCTLPSEKAVYLDASDDQVGGFSSLVDDTTPQLGGMLDVNGQALGDGTLELLKFSETGSAVNEFTIANAAASNGPTLSATGSSDSNIDINITPKGTGDVVLAADTVSVGDAAAAATLRSNGAGTLTVTTGGTTDLILSTNNGTASGTITITDAANEAITVTPNGTGVVAIEGSMNPSVSSTGKALIMGF